MLPLVYLLSFPVSYLKYIKIRNHKQEHTNDIYKLLHHSQDRIRKIWSLCNSEQRNQKRVRDSMIEFNGIKKTKFTQTLLILGVYFGTLVYFFCFPKNMKDRMLNQIVGSNWPKKKKFSFFCPLIQNIIQKNFNYINICEKNSCCQWIYNLDGKKRHSMKHLLHRGPLKQPICKQSLHSTLSQSLIQQSLFCENRVKSMVCIPQLGFLCLKNEQEDH